MVSTTDCAKPTASIARVPYKRVASAEEKNSGMLTSSAEAHCALLRKK